MLRPSIFSTAFADDLFDEFFNDSFWPAASTNHSTTGMMRTDVRENDDHYDIDIELPGYAREDIHADLKDGYLTIQASHKDENETKDENGRFLRRERYSGSCQRQFYVGDNITQEDIKGKFTDGVLQMRIPKKEAAPEVEQRKYISIEG